MCLPRIKFWAGPSASCSWNRDPITSGSNENQTESSRSMRSVSKLEVKGRTSDHLAQDIGAAKQPLGCFLTLVRASQILHISTAWRRADGGICHKTSGWMLLFVFKRLVMTHLSSARGCVAVLVMSNIPALMKQALTHKHDFSHFKKAKVECSFWSEKLLMWIDCWQKWSSKLLQFESEVQR